MTMQNILPNKDSTRVKLNSEWKLLTKTEFLSQKPKNDRNTTKYSLDYTQKRIAFETN
jgi:hypothetical protein